mgnify:CR=1 FL=1
MAKVFMTVVGMGGYDEATYRIGDNEYTNRSIQKALLTYFKDTGREFDKIVFLLTEKARENNWEKVKYTERKKADDGSELKIPHEEEGLRSFTEKLFPGKAVDKNIADGVNDNDFLSIFQQIYESMDENDEITFDVTNGFRSIPFLFYPVISYAKELKNITIDNIYYGPYVRGINPTVILDLQKYGEILDWANAAHIFRISGNAKEILQLSQKRYNGLEEKDSFGESQQASKWLSSLTEALLTCRGDDSKESISKSARKLFQSRSKMESSSRNKEYMLFDELLKHALDSVSEFNKDMNHYELGMHTAEWCIERGLVQQAYTALREAHISYLCYAFGDNNAALDKDFRGKVITAILNTYMTSLERKTDPIQDIKKVKAVSENEKYMILAVKMFSIFDKTQMSFVQQIRDIRNKINHFFMNKNSVRIDMENLKIHYNNTVEFIKMVEENKCSIMSDDEARSILNQYVPKRNNIFVNFSNHPSKNWGNEQISAAKRIVSGGSIVDIAFPQVSGDADESEISRTADKYAKEIISLNPSAVMCQGEFGICLEVVTTLKNNGIKVLYSCSERKTVETVIDNITEKTSVFKFVRFREYN